VVDGAQVAFMRIISDFASFAYLADVFVLPAFRGRGIATALVSFTMGAPGLGSIRRFLLVTRDAHGVYEKLGFTPLAEPTRYMERMNPDAYKDG
jgi:GNAT superfamily N-acetyltransferase